MVLNGVQACMIHDVTTEPDYRVKIKVNQVFLIRCVIQVQIRLMAENS